ncbi:MAG: metallophosphoesterase [Candidatus Margulisbacteria bacterium]|nr:metallophosphoesterase [Candidatus Margulisiibacteriota bacterium]
MANSNVARTNNTLGQRLINWGRNLLPGTSHRISRAYPKLTVQNLHRPLQMSELYRLNDGLANESSVSSQFFLREGALLRLSADREIVVVGDLHGNANRLDLILREYGPRLAAGEVTLLFLGDIIHPEESANMTEMRSSLETLNTVIRLKNEFPEQVHVLLGNHDVVDRDNFQMNETKRGVMQSIFFQMHLSEFFGELGYSSEDVQRMVAGYQSFFDGCPLAATVEGRRGAAYLAHAAVVKGGVTQQQLVNARSDEGLMRQLLRNRYGSDKVISELRLFGRDSSLRKTFSAADIDATIRGLGLMASPANTFIICGHTPEKERGWLYQPVPGKNLHILHSNIPNHFGVVVIKDGMPGGVPLQLNEITAAAV